MRTGRLTAPRRSRALLVSSLLAAALLVPVVGWAHGVGDPCPGECGVCEQTQCGDGKCDVAGGETCTVCPADCGKCDARCGDGKCETNKEEWCFTCPDDCSYCPEVRICNGVCDVILGEACSPVARPDGGSPDAGAGGDAGLDAGTVEWACADGVDNDGDGKSDCQDSDCAAAPGCVDAGSTEGVGARDDPDGCAVGPRAPSAPALPPAAWLALGLLAAFALARRRRSRSRQR